MEKALVEISVPTVGKSFDVFIPRTSKMSEVIFLVSKTISEAEEMFEITSVMDWNWE